MNVSEIEIGQRNVIGLQVLKIYAKWPPHYAVYLTPERVGVHFPDDLTVQEKQRGTIAKLKPLRNDINSLIDGWRSRMHRAAERAAVVMMVAAGLSACTVCYDDANGVRHVIGLTNMKIAPAGTSETLAGDVVQVESVGLLLSRNAQGGAVSIGYANQTTAAIRNNALVEGNPIDAVEKILRSER